MSKKKITKIKSMYAQAIKFCKRFFIKANTRANISRVILISSVSFVSRYLIYKYLEINVFTEYSNWISIVFYLGLATFIVFIDQFRDKINIIPNFAWFWRILSKIKKKFR